MSEDTLQVNNTSYKESQFNCQIFQLTQPTYSCQVNVGNQPTGTTFDKDACSLFNSSEGRPTPPPGYAWSNTNTPLKSDNVRDNDNQVSELLCDFTLIKQ
jgi:hypothetical protein